MDFLIILVGKTPEQGLNFGKDSKIGISKTYDFPEHIKFILKALLLLKNSDLIHTLCEKPKFRSP